MMAASTDKAVGDCVISRDNGQKQWAFLTAAPVKSTMQLSVVPRKKRV